MGQICWLLAAIESAYFCIFSNPKSSISLWHLVAHLYTILVNFHKCQHNIIMLPTFTFKNMKLGIKQEVSPVFVSNTSKSQFRTCRLLTSHFRTKSYFYLIFFLKCIFLFWKNKCICSGNNASNDTMTCKIDSFFL